MNVPKPVAADCAATDTSPHRRHAAKNNLRMRDSSLAGACDDVELRSGLKTRPHAVRRVRCGSRVRDRVDDLLEALLGSRAPSPYDDEIVARVDVNDVAALALRFERGRRRA